MYGYLASPYSHPDADVMTQRCNAVMDKANELIQKGLMVYSPITHNVPIVARTGTPPGWEQWQHFDKAMLGSAAYMLVYCLEGWEKSTGIKGELDFCAETDKPVFYLNVDQVIDEEFIRNIDLQVEVTKSVQIARSLNGWKMQNCTITGDVNYDGGPVKMDNITFDNVQLEFSGPAANTLGVLRFFASQPGGREMFFKTFPEIFELENITEILEQRKESQRIQKSQGLH